MINSLPRECVAPLFAMHVSRPRLARSCLTVLLIAGCTSTDLRSGENPPREIVADGRCPDLSGLYREEGITIRGSKSSPDAHLSWLIGGEKIRVAKKPLNTLPAAGFPLVYFVQMIRVFHPAPGRFALEALDRDGGSIGIFDFGPEDGWQCGDDAFYVYRRDQGGGEETWGDRVGMHKIYRASDGALIRSVREWFQQRSIFALGGAVGSPKTIAVDYRFSLVDR